ncbi:hypothetical protein [Janibacter melonis]|uniref:hypothetical protein n=1 Tax=Janibacter melonis TaxID=262209 RepID=UPI0017841DE7|nr:hypothetical protein [Janibacter melonis]
MRPTYAPAPSAVETGIIVRQDAMLVDPSDVEHPDELWHLVLEHGHPRDGETYCGQRVDDGPIETALVDQGARGAAARPPAALVLMCARCARLEELLP